MEVIPVCMGLKIPPLKMRRARLVLIHGPITALKKHVHGLRAKPLLALGGNDIQFKPPCIYTHFPSPNKISPFALPSRVFLEAEEH